MGYGCCVDMILVPCRAWGMLLLPHAPSVDPVGIVVARGSDAHVFEGCTGFRFQCLNLFAAQHPSFMAACHLSDVEWC
jgi:hypothetical protein